MVARTSNRDIPAQSRRTCGYSDHPLHYESRYSVLSWISYWNRLDWHGVRSLVGKRVAGDAERSLFEADAIFEGALNEAIGWNWCSIESELARMYEIYLASMWNQRLRFCPICLELGLHYIWFQFDPLAICPVHACPLTTCCLTCGAQTADYAFARRSFEYPYLCHSCSSPLCGAQLDLDAFSYRRSQSDHDIPQFDAIYSWASLGMRGFWGFREHALRFRSDCLVPWCNQRQLLASAMASLMPLPRDCATSQCGDLTLLFWLEPTLSTGKEPSGTTKCRPYSHLVRAQRVYRATLRQLRCAIANRQGFSVPDGPFALQQGAVENEPPAEVIAYFWTRYMFERCRTWQFTWDSAIEPLADEPLKLGVIGSRPSWRCIRSAVLAVYAAILCLVQGNRGVPHLCDLTKHTIEDLLVLYLLASDRCLLVGIIFPAVRWLPIPARTRRQSMAEIISLIESAALLRA